MVTDAIFGCGNMRWKGAHARRSWHVLPHIPSGKISLLSVIIIVGTALLLGIMVVVPVGCTFPVSSSSSLFETSGADNETTARNVYTQKRFPAIYTDQWAVHIPGGIEKARILADEFGFEFVTQIMDDYFLFEHKKVRRRSRRSSNWAHKDLMENPEVHWAQQQVIKKRTKRDFGGRSHYHSHQKSFDDIFNDPEWPQMWYLNRGDGLDMNVQKAWQMGYTGKGVVVTILDDGLEKDHPDIHGNYDAFASYDVNGHDHDPQPRYDPSNTNRHGTRCAGEVAAQANNSNCVVGIAFNARIGGSYS
ncbi:hypothetical protein RvY_09294-2 [Ramazzottius varieornatus]|uniref:Peptidase S8/S53 domain-containing protein n=1 Tax=Ramazzottius varieornatus TaxID=947166 RepID=A0A1D1V8U0_RAMVA|nr:hypothetical protein RvY_09294-2 [Ramazzottius varieornatus]